MSDDGKTLVPQPHLRFDNKDMWTLDDVRGHTLLSPLTLLREMSPEARDKHIAPAQRNAIVAQARALGVDTTALIWVTHERQDPAH